MVLFRGLKMKNLFNELIHRNNEYIKTYENSPIMRLINSSLMTEKTSRQKLLDCIQIFSNYFQHTVMLRAIAAYDTQFFNVALQHLKEEVLHNVFLMDDRNHRESIFDPILDGCSSWFAWKMLVIDNNDKTLLMHLVLEASANVFFAAAHNIMKKYEETDYFKIHSELDSQHEIMGYELLKDLRIAEYEELFILQERGWKMLNTLCDRIVELV